MKQYRRQAAALEIKRIKVYPHVYSDDNKSLLVPSYQDIYQS
ncbi:MAG: hypothetical protein WBZ36_14195 [Candidatus Nitrosopolaris sp.]